jgi:dihydrolipoamide dehydrogenase
MASDVDSGRFDAIVLGAGPAGETVASRLGDRGLRTALVEQELVGGECAYWACIPSKTLLRAPEVRSEAERAAGTSTPERRWQELAEYRDYMIRNLDDSGEVEGYERNGVRVLKGRARLSGSAKVQVGNELLEGERIVIATGSETRIPPIPGLQEAGYWTNREATTLSAVPDSVVVLGGGPVGIELAQLMRGFDAEVTLIESADRLLAREDPRVGELIIEALRGDGINVSCGREVSSVGTDGGDRVVRLDSGEQIRGRELIVATGRAPRVRALGLETVGLEPGEKGIEVDERCRAAEGIWAVGDVTGAMPFTHVAKYQGRIACADIAGETVRADYSAVPRVVFCNPEVAAVGMTADEARTAGLDTASAHIQLRDAIARPWTYETEPRGELEVLADRRRKILVGAWAIGPLASEWIHYAALAIKAQIPLAVLRDTVAQFPTYTEAYLQALGKLGA